MQRRQRNLLALLLSDDRHSLLGWMVEARQEPASHASRDACTIRTGAIDTLCLLRPSRVGFRETV